MNKTGEIILQHLGAVRVERTARAADAALARSVDHLKRYQQAQRAFSSTTFMARMISVNVTRNSCASCRAWSGCFQPRWS
jgi:hypothetical protein